MRRPLGPQRGTALATVLALVAVLLIVGLAMGTLSVLSLRFQQKRSDSLQSELAARSALAKVLAKIYSVNAEATLNPLQPENSELSALFPGLTSFSDGAYTTTFHFDPKRRAYSRDNLTGDSSSIGSLDSDGVPRIPAFSLDLVLAVEGPNQVRHYRAILKKVWPYAVFVNRGPVVLMGQPKHEPRLSFDKPSQVKGDIFTSWRGNLAAGGAESTGYGLGRLDTPRRLLANVEASSGYQPRSRPNHPLILGMELGFNPPPEKRDIFKVPGFAFYRYLDTDITAELNSHQKDPTFGAGEPHFTDQGNHLEGDFFYDHDLGVKVEPLYLGAPGDNTMDGRSIERRAPVLDPLAEISGDGASPMEAFHAEQFEVLKLKKARASDSTQAWNAYLEPLLGDWNWSQFELVDEGDEEPYFLDETLRLTRGENSTGGKVTSHYTIRGSVSNRSVIYEKVRKQLFVRESRAGLDLQGVVLHVHGDLDLSADGSGEPIPISGAGATLIVEGQLVLGNAQIHAEDQGFVVYAKDIVLKGGGKFFGLMIAENSMTILSQSGNTLEIEGGVLCGGRGGIVLRGARVKHEPRYLKAINAGGEFYLHSWAELNAVSPEG